MKDINKLIDEADKNCKEMVRLLKECIEILERMEKMVDESLNEINK
tara:strand:- start:14724 stop:14861 length:138 start_codon:yes stop_codon:yes gene_type:complete